MPSPALASLFPVHSRFLNGPAQEVQQTTLFFVSLTDMCKIVENPSAVIPTMSKFHVRLGMEESSGLTPDFTSNLSYDHVVVEPPSWRSREERLRPVWSSCHVGTQKARL